MTDHGGDILNDIAVIKLNRPVQITSELYPICLASKMPLTVGDHATAIGYGQFRDNAKDLNKADGKLRAVEIPIRKCLTKTDNVCTSTPNVGTEHVSQYLLFLYLKPPFLKKTPFCHKALLFPLEG